MPAQVPNEIVNCEKCGLWVHQQCYAIKEIPEGEWLCWPCKADLDPDAIKCAICPVRRGAFKKSTCGNWVHVVCAHWMPEVTVLDEDCDIAIDGVQAISRERSRLTCHVCSRKEGACLQCNFGHCQVAFHPLCARSAGSFVNMRRDASTGATVFCAYCDRHSQMQRERIRAKGREIEPLRSLPGVSPASLPASKVHPNMRFSANVHASAPFLEPSSAAKTSVHSLVSLKCCVCRSLSIFVETWVGSIDMRLFVLP